MLSLGHSNSQQLLAINKEQKQNNIYKQDEEWEIQLKQWHPVGTQEEMNEEIMISHCSCYELPKNRFLLHTKIKVILPPLSAIICQYFSAEYSGSTNSICYKNKIFKKDRNFGEVRKVGGQFWEVFGVESESEWGQKKSYKMIQN